MAISSKYKNISRDYTNGVARYGNDSALRKELRDQSNPKNAEAIEALKAQLKKEVDDQIAQRRAVFRQLDDPKRNNPVISGKLLKAKNADEQQTNKNIEQIIRRLSLFGVSAKRGKDGSVSFKNMNEGGEPTMVYDVTKLKQMKLETFQESAAGTIRREAADYLIKYFDVMIEAAKAGDLNELVMGYVAACKNNDEERKAELKEKITAASDCKKAKAELENLKESLSDEEKKFVEELDAEICGNDDGESKLDTSKDTPVKESGTDSGCSTGDTKAATGGDTAKSEDDTQKKLEKSASTAGTDNKESFEQLLSAATEGTAISDIGRNAMLDYITEAVASGNMDSDVAITLTSMVRL